MKKFLTVTLVATLLALQGYAQTLINDESLRYQQQRMVFKQWDQDKFTPTSGFLGLNPYYWLTWGWFYPNYHKTDLRPLSADGPQTQRLALAAEMKSTDVKYKLQSDTARSTALSVVASQSGLAAAADPLWLLYYQNELAPVLNHSMASLLAGLPAQVSAKLVSEGTYGWYSGQLDMLGERLQAAHSADMDRGARIMSYHRLLLEYRRLAGVWSLRTSSAQTTLTRASQLQTLRAGQITLNNWTPQTDVRIATQVLQHIQ